MIGLEGIDERFRSVRPIPRSSYAWNKFPYGRGDHVAFDLSAMLVVPPHVEDRLAGNDKKRGSVAEVELVKCLRQAEVATSVKELFGCDVHASPYGGAAVYVDPQDGKRSICGCEVESVRFSLKFFPRLRAALALKSGESLQSLPIVDVDWFGFAVGIGNQVKDNPNFLRKLQSFFDSFVRDEIMSSQIRFARIGLARPDRDGFCWLMLDSLFPRPKKEWLQQFTH